MPTMGYRQLQTSQIAIDNPLGALVVKNYNPFLKKRLGSRSPILSFGTVGTALRNCFFLLGCLLESSGRYSADSMARHSLESTPT